MTRNILIGIGIMLSVIHGFISPIALPVQMFLFFGGIILLGIPHGAADLLVAVKNAQTQNQKFSKPLFFIKYLSKIFFFGLMLWLLPVVGICVFILVAAYHFGETDLHQFQTNIWTGKLFVIMYGLVILSVILLHHFNEVEPLLQLILPNRGNNNGFFFIQQQRYTILSIIFSLFFITTFYYFLSVEKNTFPSASFLVRLAVILVILYNLPMILAFAFYFIVWHSTLSLRNIVLFLKQDNSFTTVKIAGNIALYSLIALAGLALFGLSGIVLTNYNALIVDVLLALAVLTTPHMHIMHTMYKTFRLYKG